MTTNFPLRFAALGLCTAVLVGTLAACGGNRNTQTTTTGTTTASSTSTAATSDTGMTGSGTSAIDGIIHGSTSGDVRPGTGSSGMTGSGSGVVPGGSGVAGSSDMAGEVDLDRATVRFNGADYRISRDEQLRRDELGIQLLIVQRVVDTPERDGDAIGLPEGTRVHAIKDNKDYSALAVELDGMFYRANKQAD
ncbi:MAG: hypothetical protein E7463_04470 [Ruminococcaceae bacterium]|nr:hypothetical protein [Oscillospiraceae bacterium]